MYKYHKYRPRRRFCFHSRPARISRCVHSTWLFAWVTSSSCVNLKNVSMSFHRGLSHFEVKFEKNWKAFFDIQARNTRLDKNSSAWARILSERIRDSRTWALQRVPSLFSRCVHSAWHKKFECPLEFVGSMIFWTRTRTIKIY
jgi:hypothetical protein